MASETTPLLPGSNGTEDTFPPILSAAQRLLPDPTLFHIQNLYPHPLGTVQPLRAVAFQLLLVLHLLVSDSDEYIRSGRQSTIRALQDFHEKESRRENLRRIASAILEDIPVAITSDGATEDVPKDVSVEHILFSSFPMDIRSSQWLRVIDILAHPAVPTEILCDPIINLSLLRLWKYGRATLEPMSSESPLRRLSRMYDAAPTPRAVHAVHIAAHLAYLVVLAHLILYPAPRPILLKTPGGPIGFREPIIATYSISNLAFNPLSLSAFLHTLVLFPLLISLPSSPSPNIPSFDLLILALCLHILFVQFPNYPTISLLFEPPRWLPLSSLYASSLTRYLLPAFVFLLPVLLTSIILFSLSLSGPILTKQVIDSTSTTPTSTAPLSAFLALFGIGCFLFLYLSLSSLLLSPSPVHKDKNRWDWETYGAAVGIAGRRSLVRAILAYSPSCEPMNLAYPPPLNILSLPLKALPWLPRRIYKFFWRLVVGPIAFIAGGLWGWGLLQGDRHP